MPRKRPAALSEGQLISHHWKELQVLSLTETGRAMRMSPPRHHQQKYCQRQFLVLKGILSSGQLRISQNAIIFYPNTNTAILMPFNIKNLLRKCQ